MTTEMNRGAVERFAREWVDAWNQKDVEAILAHFTEEATFTSPLAATTVGTATVTGKDALRAYWQAAVARAATLDFALDHVVWDGERAELVILYTRGPQGQRSRACEWMRFDPSGDVVAGEALYGAGV